MRIKYKATSIIIWRKEFVFFPLRGCGICKDHCYLESMYHKINPEADGLSSCNCTRLTGALNWHYWHCKTCHALFLLKQGAA